MSRDHGPAALKLEIYTPPAFPYLVISGDRRFPPTHEEYAHLHLRLSRRYTWVEVHTGLRVFDELTMSTPLYLPERTVHFGTDHWIARLLVPWDRCFWHVDPVVVTPGVIDFLIYVGGD